jgi:hypothetical protein
MSSIKLTADSGGGTFEIKAPSSSSNTRVLTLPDTGNLTLGGPYGKILQVVNTLFTTPITSTNNTYETISGFNATITPTSTSSKILIMVSAYSSTRNSVTIGYAIFRSVGGVETDLRTHQGGGDDFMFVHKDQDENMVTTSYTHLDSPNTTSAVTYLIKWKGDSTQLKALNRLDSGEHYQGNSTITLMEVAA